ncbi:hypothetical protein F5Y08DRAFT_81064 [Xylaria arbuscula]|nr:hypothetical protein F5Y08DRAFT_81064 [Xylaria arbuscula]
MAFRNVSALSDFPNQSLNYLCRLMHQVALLRAEVQDLHEAYQTLSKRHRAKKMRVRQGGSLYKKDKISRLKRSTKTNTRRNR